MRVLVDFHHPDLYWSFVLTLERRLGWEVYRTIGMEWFTEGYWQFEKSWAGDKFAKMFLPLNPLRASDPTVRNPNQEDEDRDTHWERIDTRHPGYQYKMLTLSQARDADIDIVIATVPANQIGFKKFADEIGAKFVIQAGNAEHPINWNLEPLVLDSTSNPIPTLRKSSVLKYDQEIDPSFDYEPVQPNKVVSSFTLDWNYEDFRRYNLMVNLMGDYSFNIYGKGGTYLTETPMVAQKMKESEIIWHTKRVGDGWGHVIHGAMAVGRPLIGVKTYYHGRRAERLWTPDNAIMIDRFDAQKVARTLRYVHDDPSLLRRMGDASRALWDEFIDYEKDAANIGNFLGG